ncbi:hypothetical protein [Saccharothrix variisporea]|uniref:Uncharacterized protein n=1 Tax=Saccharothrix variisporea TaxID=543527 RepID=A0A495XH11_9PSEU|nr:hypothetical protein [Saccharothrix variisporea]RKT72476.1 hypothetical protein DFJ66_5790 [Saccharothrix variisporea]
MNPNPGWQQQPQPGAPQQYQGQPPLGGAYPQQPYPGQPPAQPYGQPHPGQYPGMPGQPGQPGQPGMPMQYPGHPRKPSAAAAVVAGLLFLPAVIYTYIAAGLSWTGKPPSPHIGVSVLGMAFSEDITRNGDFAITISMIVASIVLLLALVQVFRVPGVRWGLVVLGALCTVYYIYAVIWIVANGGGEYAIVPAVCLLLWLAATIVAALPAVGRASRRFGPPQPGLAPPPPAHWG